jgi:hypothetical protein
MPSLKIDGTTSAAWTERAVKIKPRAILRRVGFMMGGGKI